MNMSLNQKCRSSVLFLLFTLVFLFTPSFAQSQDDAQNAQRFFNEGNTLTGKRDYATAIVKYTEAAKLAPKWHLPILNRGVAYLSLSKYDEAASDADTALGLIKPDAMQSEQHSAIAYQIKGVIKQYRGDLNAALVYFSKAVEFVPADAKMHNSRGNALQFLNRNEEAAAAYSEAIKHDPSMAMFYVNRAVIQERLKKNDEALSDLTKALELDKNNSLAYYARAGLRTRSKAYDEALNDYNEAIRLDSSKPIYFHARGLLYTHKKEYALAIKDHTKALSLDPKNILALSDRAIAQDRTGNTKAAVEDARAASAMNPDSLTLKYNLGYLLYKNGQFTESAQIITKIIEKMPNWKTPYILRSNCYVKLKMDAKARADRAIAATLRAGGGPTNEGYMFFDLSVVVPEVF